MPTNIYQTYFPIVNSNMNGASTGLEPITVGVDPDNSNTTGALASVPFVKRVGLTIPTGTAAGSVSFKVPAPCAILALGVQLQAVGGTAAITTAGVLNFGQTNTAGGSPGVYGNVTLGNSSLYAQYTLSTAFSNGTIQPDASQNYATIWANITGASLTGAGSVIYTFNLLFCDASYYNTN